MCESDLKPLSVSLSYPYGACYRAPKALMAYFGIKLKCKPVVLLQVDTTIRDTVSYYSVCNLVPEMLHCKSCRLKARPAQGAPWLACDQRRENTCYHCYMYQKRRYDPENTPTLSGNGQPVEYLGDWACVAWN